MSIFNMKKFLSSAVILVLMLTLSFTLASCNNSSSDEGLSPIEIEVKNFMEKFHDKFNDGKYEEFISYYSIDQTQKDEMLGNFKFMSQLFTITYDLESVRATEISDGRISAEVVSTSTSVSKADNNKTVIRETQFYVFERTENNDLSIVQYSSGQSELVEE